MPDMMNKSDTPLIDQSEIDPIDIAKQEAVSENGLVPPKRTTDWISIYVAATITYVGAVQFSLYLTSIWPYLKTIDTSSKEIFLGFVVAGYSIGQMIASPVVGYWSNKIRRISPPLYLG